MLGCGAHVRIIALPHVRCACGSACGKAFKTVRAVCVRVARLGRAMCDSTFSPFPCTLLLHTLLLIILNNITFLKISLPAEMPIVSASPEDWLYGVRVP